MIDLITSYKETTETADIPVNITNRNESHDKLISSQSEQLKLERETIIILRKRVDNKQV